MTDTGNERARFCSQCGQPVMVGDAVFCKECGAPLAGTQWFRHDVTWHPFTALVLSVFPGLGHWYKGQPRRAIIWFLAVAFFYSTAPVIGLLLHMICAETRLLRAQSAKNRSPGRAERAQTVSRRPLDRIRSEFRRHSMLAPNTIVGGRYRVVKTLGGGGMKLVYLAEDLRLAARSCALAEMVDSFTNPDAQTQAVAAFQREADMLARLSNEHIPRVFDRFSEANHHFLVMEYIEGVTLEEELHKNGGKLAPDRVIAIAVQVLDTLEYLHNLTPPVIYRDLKPSNVMIAPGGQAKLIDFGIARHFQPLTNATMIGTQGYAPPEQYRGKVETRSDLYALGATMHQALSGRDPAVEAPFSFPPLRKLCPDLNADLAAIVDQSLAYDVVNRPYDAVEFRRRLIEAANGASAATTATNVSGATNHASAKPQLKLPLEVSRPGSAGSSPAAGAATPPSTPVSPTVLSVANEIRCPSCARTIPSDSRFCSYCAADLSPGATPKFANPNDPTRVLSTPYTGARGPSAEVEVPVRHGRSGDFRRRRHEHHRRARRRPLLLLLLIFLGSFVLMKIIRGTAASNPAPSYNTGSSGYPPPAPPESSYADPRFNALRMALDAGGYSDVKFRPDGDALEIWGNVPNNFDLSNVEMICMTLGFSKLEVRLQVTDNAGMG